MNPTMTVAWVFRHKQAYEHVLTTADARFETLAYWARQNRVDVLAPCDTPQVFTRGTPPPVSGLFTVHALPDFSSVLGRLAELKPQVVVYEGCPVDDAEPEQVRAATPDAFLAFYYGGGPFLDVHGIPHPMLRKYEAIFVPHRTQARMLAAHGITARVAYGVPTHIFRPLPEVPKLWHALVPTAFVPSKRPVLPAQYVEQYAPPKQSLFLGRLEHPDIIDMVRMGGIPLNMDGPHRNNVRVGGHAPQALMPFLYNAAEVVILGSQEEGHPNVIMEAMACGTPCIVMADCEWEVAAAFQELITEGYAPGIQVVPPSTSAIFTAVETALSDPAVSARRARAAIVDHYPWWNMYETIDHWTRSGLGLKLAGQAI